MSSFISTNFIIDFSFTVLRSAATIKKSSYKCILIKFEYNAVSFVVCLNGTVKHAHDGIKRDRKFSVASRFIFLEVLEFVGSENCESSTLKTGLLHAQVLFKTDFTVVPNVGQVLRTLLFVNL
jgi:hypothetical protein